ncbi:MAG: hypothetical protein ABR575_09785 [Actinomycetota bacterium]
MSTAAAPDKRWPTPIVAVVALAMAALGVLGYVGAGFVAERVRVGEPPTVRDGRMLPGPAAQGLEARWKIDSYAAGGKVPRAERAAFRGHRARLADVIRDVYSTSLVGPPERLRTLVAERFSPRARAAFARARLGIPAGVGIERIAGAARIGLDAAGARRAAALVTVTVRATGDEAPFTVRQRSTLWLERDRHGWRVMAFDIDQRRSR